MTMTVHKAVMIWFVLWHGYWQCSWCGQSNPNHSNTCWKCGASR